jgi:hypothetical protein
VHGGRRSSSLVGCLRLEACSGCHTVRPGGSD